MEAGTSLQSFKLVSPDGVLHLLPDEKRAKIDFVKAHGLKDKKYLQYHLDGKQDETYGWQLLEKVRWLQHRPSGTCQNCCREERAVTATGV